MIDVYWDSSRQLWSLCPAELGDLGSGSGDLSETTASVETTSTTTASLSAAQLTARSAEPSTLSDTGALLRRQIPDTVSSRGSVSGQTSAVGALTTTNVESVVANPSTTYARNTTVSGPTPSATLVPGTSETLYQVGPYECTASIDINTFADVLAGHFAATANNLNATLKWAVLNVHAAVPASNPYVSAPAPERGALPSDGNVMSQVLNSSLAAYLYTPYDLQTQRATPNLTWYSVNPSYWPVSGYFSLDTIGNGVSTTTGWPDEAYTELLRTKRVLMGFGTIDPQMEAYDTAGDIQTIFSPGYTIASDNVILSATGSITEGCFFDPGSTLVSAANNSFAISEVPLSQALQPGLDYITKAAQNMTACGIAPVLNQTLGDQTADINITAYSSFVQNTIWSWAPGQPNDIPDSEQDSDSTVYNCAVLNMTNGGQWQVGDCTDRHYAACRVGNAPYAWTVSNQRGQYYQVDDACDDDSSFDVPRTALENSYLRAAILASDSSDEMIWVNYNDLDVTGCWVDGVNSTCPYVSDRSALSSRSISVPIGASVLVFVMAALTIFIKCGANRQRSRRRRRRRGDDGGEYEGIPS